MITFEEDIRNENIKDIAKMLMTAARTAPKARGTDNLVLAVATDDTIVEIAEKMKQLAVERNMDFLNRDAENILNCGAVVLFGMKISPLGLNCGACGFATCGEKPKNVPCFFNANDLGIAIGSAASLAADLRVDSRVMFSVGQAVLALNMMPECSMVLALPLAVKGKSIFFDRK
ncbi:MAG: ferredoxin [Bacteroidales bacterium]|nr:ferredoxin [Bacteroidales bacterium]MBR3915091.1 ferredoxin [Bacteroidales bacterium]